MFEQQLLCLHIKMFIKKAMLSIFSRVIEVDDNFRTSNIVRGCILQPF
jgi:hypothetical protein